MDNQKSHWRHLTNEQYLGAWDLEKDGKYIEVILTIEKIYSGEMVGQMGKQQKPFIKFKEYKKPMICNKTNFKRLENRFRTPHHQQYVGQQIVLHVERVKAPDGEVDALRIMSKPPQPQTPVKKPITDERLDSAIIQIEGKSYSKEELLVTFELTNEQQTKLDLI